MIVYITEEYLSILNEKKTASQYRKDKFKKTYDFKPDKNDKSGNTGTIKMNGRRVNVDLDGQQTAANLVSDKPEIQLSKSYWKLPKKYGKAVLDHEDGHNRLHNINSKNTYADKKNKTKEVYKSTIHSLYKNSGVDLDNDESVKRYKYRDPNLVFYTNDEVRDDAYKNTGIKNVDIDKYNRGASKNKDEIKKRNESLNAAKKHVSSSRNHDTALEYEADRYSANRNGDKNMIKSLGKHYKTEKRDLKKQAKRETYSNLLSYAKSQGKSNNQIKKMGRKGLEKLALRDRNISVDDDLKARGKALKDQKLKDSDIYK